VVLRLIVRSKRDIHVASDAILASIRSPSIPTPRVDLFAKFSCKKIYFCLVGQSVCVGFTTQRGIRRLAERSDAQYKCSTKMLGLSKKNMNM
jgi:hypothetical protein